MASIAATSMREWFSLPEFALPIDTMVPMLASTYVTMGAFMWWVVRAAVEQGVNGRAFMCEQVRCN
jgi:hydrogenase-4 membrane subunit HyfE